MATFSPKARRMIETAVVQLPDDFQRQAWDAWSRANTDVRRAGDSFVGYHELPRRVAVIAVSALERMSANLSISLADPSLDEDAICDLEGDISFIKSIEAMLIDRLNSAQAAA